MAEQSLKDKTVKGVSWRDIVTLKKYIFFFITVFAVLVIIDRMIPSLARYYYRHTYKSLNVKDGAEFEKEIRDATFRLIESESWGNKPMVRSLSYFQYWSNNLFGENTIMGYGEYGYLLHYAFLYAEKQGDKAMMALVKEKFDKYWLEGGSFERSDQVTHGTVALDLFRWTNNGVYKSLADSIFKSISKETERGLILYRKGTSEQNVDAVGLVCPFLYYYSSVSKDTLAYSLAKRMSEDYILWGTDPITGIPCQTYDIRSHIKKNHANWGRGTSWYLLGIRQLETEDSVINKRIERLDSTLVYMDTYLYPQYLGEEGLPDMSATIPILYYLNSKGYMQITKDQLAQLLCPYIGEDGIIRYGSPSISSPHEGVNIMITNLFCQGLLLYFVSEL